MARDLPPQLTKLLEASDEETKENAWSHFLGRYSPIILYTARKLARDYDEAMDRYRFVLTELHKDDYRRLRAYVADQRSTFSNWLIVVASRLCTDYHRQRYGRARDAEVGRAAQETRAARRRLADFDLELLDPATVASPSSPNPEQHLRIAELSEALFEALGFLDARDRLLIKLRFEDDRSVKEIAGIMGYASVFHVYRRLKSLSRTLRENLKERGIDEPRP